MTQGIATAGTALSQHPISTNLEFLDEINCMMRNNHDLIPACFTQLVESLFELRASLQEPDWKRIIPELIQHPIGQLLYQGPFTLRCFQKPRGFAGDAVMLDFAYDRIPPANTTDIGRAVFLTATNHPLAMDTRYRKSYLAETIDQMSDRRGNLNILSVACGQLREAEESRAVMTGKVASYVALDQDWESLGYIENRLGLPWIKTIQATVRDILLRRLSRSNIQGKGAARAVIWRMTP